jgi:hypothetical protein
MSGERQESLSSKIQSVAVLNLRESLLTRRDALVTLTHGAGFAALAEWARAEDVKPTPAPKPPFIAWFEPPLIVERPELYRGATRITSLAERQASVLPKRAF